MKVSKFGLPVTNWAKDNSASWPIRPFAKVMIFKNKSIRINGVSPNVI